MKTERIELRELPQDEFFSLISNDFDRIFLSDSVRYPLQGELNPELVKAENALRSYRVAAFRDQKVVGWHYGIQLDRETYLMKNSAVLPEYRRQGIYSELLNHVVEKTFADGFNAIVSRHYATNNAVIVPKLKQGFYISGLNLSGTFGCLVELTRFKALEDEGVLRFRSGEKTFKSIS